MKNHRRRPASATTFARGGRASSRTFSSARSSATRAYGDTKAIEFATAKTKLSRGIFARVFGGKE